MGRYYLFGFGLLTIVLSLVYVFRYHIQDALFAPPAQFDETFEDRLTNRLSARFYGDLDGYVVWHRDQIVFEW